MTLVTPGHIVILKTGVLVQFDKLNQYPDLPYLAPLPAPCPHERSVKAPFQPHSCFRGVNFKDKYAQEWKRGSPCFNLDCRRRCDAGPQTR
jgi:hypothetical protein